MPIANVAAPLREIELAPLRIHALTVCCARMHKHLKLLARGVMHAEDHRIWVGPAAQGIVFRKMSTHVFAIRDGILVQTLLVFAALSLLVPHLAMWAVTLHPPLKVYHVPPPLPWRTRLCH